MIREQSQLLKISIIAPAYNEEKIILEFIKKVSRAVIELNLDYELIMIDDGSNDTTCTVTNLLVKKNPRVKIIKNGINHGKGYSVRKGFLHSTGQIVAFIDLDMPINSKQLKHYLRKLSEADIVIASKRHRHSSVNYPPLRSFLSICFNLLVRTLFRLPFLDTQCGFKLFKVGVLAKLVPRLLTNRYAFDVELLVNAKRKGYHIVEVPITINKNRRTFDVKDIFWMFTDLLLIFSRLHLTQTYD